MGSWPCANASGSVEWTTRALGDRPVRTLKAGAFLMSRQAVLAAGTFLLASTIAASAGGIGFGLVIGPGGIGPGFHSAEPPREYHPRVRSYHEEASRPRRQQRQHADDDEKAEAAAPAKSQANENSSIAVLDGMPNKPDLQLENSSIASAPHPAEPARSATVAELENSSIASAPRPAEPAQPATVAVTAESPVEQAASSHPVLCSRYFPTAGRTVQGPCE